MSCAAPSALIRARRIDPGLTAGAIDFRLFEAPFLRGFAAINWLRLCRPMLFAAAFYANSGARSRNDQQPAFAFGNADRLVWTECSGRLEAIYLRRCQSSPGRIDAQRTPVDG